MPEQVKLAKAKLQELDSSYKTVINPDRSVTVQFNPETLKVSFSNQIAQPAGAGDDKQKAASQFVGSGTTKLSLQLWFDVAAPMASDAMGGGAENDVRKLTQKVAYFITPRENNKQFIPPVVRFIWGTFQFDGIVESMEESIEFFSADGRPQRASVSLSIAQQRITEFAFAAGSGGAAASPGTSPLTAASAGVSLQAMASLGGQGANWQDIAQANNIENPRILEPGQLIDLNASAHSSL